MTLKQKSKRIRAAAKASYDFIETCYTKGLCTFEEAKKALISVSNDCQRDIENLYRDEQFMLDRQLESRSV